jgi:16S rRNA (uracil1498-N3)-methyltransferase
MADRFYVNCDLAPGPVVLGGPEARHLATVCRLRPGDPVCLFNGDGHEYPGRVAEVTRRSVTVEVLGVESPDREVGFRLEVAAPLPKGDRAQFLLEKLTELGVTAFFPLRTARSVAHPHEAKLDKLQRHVIEASKQCGRNVLLQVRQPLEWDALCGLGDEAPPRRFLAHPGGRAGAGGRGEDVLLAVGPEGGLTAEEVARAGAAGWQTVGLGPRILREETAALALAALFGGA